MPVESVRTSRRSQHDRHGRPCSISCGASWSTRASPASAYREAEPSIEKLCDPLIDAVCERGECDFVRDLAAPLPMAVIGDMLGVPPRGTRDAAEWSDDLVSGAQLDNDPKTACQRSVDAYGGYNEYTMASIAERRSDPTDDLISVLVHAEVDGTAAQRRRDRVGNPADPDRRRRDHPPYARPAVTNNCCGILTNGTSCRAIQH